MVDFGPGRVCHTECDIFRQPVFTVRGDFFGESDPETKPVLLYWSSNLRPVRSHSVAPIKPPQFTPKLKFYNFSLGRFLHNTKWGRLTLTAASMTKIQLNWTRIWQWKTQKQTETTRPGSKRLTPEMFNNWLGYNAAATSCHRLAIGSARSNKERKADRCDRLS